MSSFYKTNKNTIFNILGVIVGCIIGGILNGLIIQMGYKLIPPAPEFNHAIPETYTFLKPMNYIGPFLAHAFHSLVGAYIACKIGLSNHKKLAMIVGFLTLLGGLWVAVTFPIPTWYTILDLSCAYIPFAILGWILAGKKS